MYETNWIDVCKVGTWIANSGASVTLSAADFDAIAAGYKPSEREAPLVFGHPALDDPAFGWATAFRRAGDFLQAKFKQVPQAVKDLVDSGAYKKISLALMPDKRTVRHVGLLGAAQPAVPGLKSVSFAEGESALEIEFANQAGSDPHERRNGMTIEQLQAELSGEKQKSAQLTEENGKLKVDLAAANDKAKAAETNLAAFQGAQRKQSIEDRIDKLIAEGKLKPAAKPEKLMVALSLANDIEEIELAAGQGKKSKLEIYLAALESEPKLGLVGHEFTAPDKDKDRDTKQVDLTKHV